MKVLHCAAVSQRLKQSFPCRRHAFHCHTRWMIAKTVRNAGRCCGTAMYRRSSTRRNFRVDTIKAIVKAGIPVMGHVGLTPQSSTALGGFKVQGKDKEGARRVLRTRLPLGSRCFRCSPGMCSLPPCEAHQRKAGDSHHWNRAGPIGDGRVLVLHDVIDLYGAFRPKFVQGIRGRRQSDHRRFIEVC